MRPKFRVVDHRQAGNREAPQHRARQPLRDQAQGGLFRVRRDAGEEAAAIGTQHVLRRRLRRAVAAFDQEQIDRAAFDEPGEFRIAHVERQVARAGHEGPRFGGERGERATIRAYHRTMPP